MLSQTEFKKALENRPDLQKFLFIRGFLIADREIEDMSGFPFYGNWKAEKHGDWYFMAHNLTGMHIYETADGKIFFLMGHAYNPFTMEHEEQPVLARIAESYGTEAYIDRINEITGVFVLGVMENGKAEFLVDPSGMQSACYGKVGDTFYISSHPQLIGDLCNLTMDGFVKELIAYKWYGRVFGPYLPIDLSPFAEVKRIVPSIYYDYMDGAVHHKRFWPLEHIEIADDAEAYDKCIRDTAQILKNNMELVSRKWKHPAISLTGGIDSNTTFAAANGIYDRFETFSYVSAEKEIRDAEAAKKIADRFGVKHTVYNVPQDASTLADYDLKVEIQAHNSGYIATRYGNESRKRVYLQEHCDIDVEVKSWVSETIRGYFFKHFARKKMPPLSPKVYRDLYKIFITNRKLAHKIDRLFETFIPEFEYDKIPEEYPNSSIYYNELMWGSWGGLNISEMKFCFDITFIYNNRIFLDNMFHVPLEKQISDQHHLDMKKYLNPELYDMNIRVVNMKETDFRAHMLNVIFTLNRFLP